MKPNYQYHKCNKIPQDDIRIVYSNHYGQRNEHVWCLVVERTATEEDLDENHYLEEIGQILWSTQIEIRHCPYCGKELFDPEINKMEDYGQFLHINPAIIYKTFY